MEKVLGKNAEKFAAIVLEPDTFDKPDIGFLKEVRKVCDKYGIILVFDEIICGFRTKLGGAAKKYKVFLILAASARLWLMAIHLRHL